MTLLDRIETTFVSHLLTELSSCFGPSEIADKSSDNSNAKRGTGGTGTTTFLEHTFHTGLFVILLLAIVLSVLRSTA
jgi:hypothetical protein